MYALEQLVRNGNPIEPVAVNEKYEKLYSELVSLGMEKSARRLRQSINYTLKKNRIAEYKYIAITQSQIESFIEIKNQELVDLEKFMEEERKRIHLDSRTDIKLATKDQISKYAGKSFLERITEKVNPSTILPYEFGFKVNVADFDNMFRDIYGDSFFRWDWGVNSRTSFKEYVWVEVDHRNYEGIPPQSILDVLSIHKERQCFDSFTISTVELRNTKLPDPLLFGRLKGDTNRYFISQWGDDVALDDVI